MALSKTSYLIVFDDIRAYGDDGWYSNLTLAPPPDGEWGERLGYGLPKGKHRGAVLVTCRKEDDARSMVRTGRVVRPPRLHLDDAWRLFRREYDQAKDAAAKERKMRGLGGGPLQAQPHGRGARPTLPHLSRRRPRPRTAGPGPPCMHACCGMRAVTRSGVRRQRRHRARAPPARGDGITAGRGGARTTGTG